MALSRVLEQLRKFIGFLFSLFLFLSVAGLSPVFADDACTINYRVTRNSDGTFNLAGSVNTSELDPEVEYIVTLDTGVFNTIDYHFTPQREGFNFVTPLDAGHVNDTFFLYVRRNSCFEIAGGACAISDCGVDVTFPEDAPVIDIDYGNVTDVSQIDPRAQAEQAAAPNIAAFDYCEQVPSGTQRTSCLECVEKGGPGEYVYTAVGCIRTAGQGLTQDLIRILMGMSGGIALLSILAGAFLYTTSQGDSSKVKEAKALITASVSGLFFIIFSIFILQFIGVSIFRIPGLGGSVSRSSSSTFISDIDQQRIEQSRNEPQNVWAAVNGSCVQCSFNDFQPGGRCSSAETFDTSDECSGYVSERAASRQLTNSWVVQGDSCYQCYNQDFESGQACAGQTTFSTQAICNANRTQAAGGGSVEWYISGSSCAPCQQGDYTTSGTCASAYLYSSQEACSFAINEPEAVTPSRITCGHNNQTIDPSLQQCCPGMAPVQQADGNMLCGGQITFTAPQPRFVNASNQWVCPSTSGVNGCTCNFPDGNRRMNAGEICPSGSDMIVIQESEQPLITAVPSTCALFGQSGEVREYCWCGGEYSGFRIEPGQSCLSAQPLVPVILNN